MNQFRISMRFHTGSTRNSRSDWREVNDRFHGTSDFHSGRALLAPLRYAFLMRNRWQILVLRVADDKRAGASAVTHA
ncbi:hypothetical protein BN2476_590086 [Paraburkholderia piptadeniae]|uniref:Uncharacterized protein n=1 Tax=Paraburkholderia piptadeniae TaxID=1701573 RepID=A0A1N7SK35_9BURK|nr:hypothetical protein BN2476_590086 [Paraburkholderia piptadeniae]